MNTILPVLLSMCLLQPALQDQNGKPAVAPTVTAPVVVKQPLAFGLEDGTPVKLKLNRTISSADAHVNDTVDFEVLEQVTVKDDIIIPRGSMAWGTVTEAEPKRRMARGGKLNVNIDSVRLASGEKIPLRAVKDVKGGGHVGAMTGAMVATAIVFFPAAPLFLFMKGKDITIPQGTEITAYTSGDIPLDASKFVPDPTLASAIPTAVASATMSALPAIDIKSTPDGAEITVDDKYMGSTPSTLRLAPGDHQVKLEKSGFTTWQKTLTVTAGASATVNASLEQQANP
jgi:PEGA domain